MSYNDKSKEANNIKKTAAKNSQAVGGGYFLLFEAAKQCSYTQEYLSLLARQGELRAEKFGRNWYTRIEWLREYIEKHASLKKGNVKGEMLEDKKIKDEIKASPLNDSLGSYLKRKIVNSLKSVKKCFNKLKADLKKLYYWWSNIFLQLKVAKKKKASKRVTDNLGIRQLLIALSVGKKIKVTRADWSLLAKARELKDKLAEQFKANKNLVYPMRQGAVQSLLIEARELLEVLIGSVSIRNYLIWLWQEFLDCCRGIVFKIKLSAKALVMMPVFSLRYWPAFSWQYRLRAVTVSSLIILFLGSIGLAQVKPALVSSWYDQSLQAVADYSRVLQEKNEKNYQGLSYFSGQKFGQVTHLVNQEEAGNGQVAGSQTVNLPKALASLALASIRAVENLPEKAAEDYAGEYRLDEMAIRGILVELKEVPANLTGKIWADDRLAFSKIPTPEFPLGLWGRELMLRWHKVLARESVLVNSDWGNSLRDVVVERLVNRQSWLVNMIFRFGRQNYAVLSDRTMVKSRDIKHLADAIWQTMEKISIGTNERLARLFNLIKNPAEVSTRVAQGSHYSHLVIDKMEDRLGDGYLKLLSFLNIQPKYSQYTTDRIIFGKSAAGSGQIIYLDGKQIVIKKGEAGQAGLAGAPGPQGEQGEKGERGERGLPGLAGSTGQGSGSSATNIYNVGAPGATAKDGAGSAFSARYGGFDSLSVTDLATLEDLVVTDSATFQSSVVMQAGLAVSSGVSAANLSSSGYLSVGSGTPNWALAVGDGYFSDDLEIDGSLKVDSATTTDPAVWVAVSPLASATDALLTLGANKISSGSANGTFIGANQTTFSGDFINFQVADVSKFKVDKDGNIITAGTASHSGTMLVEATSTPQLTVRYDTDHQWQSSVDNKGNLTFDLTSATNTPELTLLDPFNISTSTAVDVFNITASTTENILDIKSSSTDYLVKFDQMGSGGIFDWQRNDASVLSLSNEGVLTFQNASSTHSIISATASSTAPLAIFNQTGAGSVFRFDSVPAASSTIALLQLTVDPMSSGSASGTFIAANPQSFSGNFLDFQAAGTRYFSIASDGDIFTRGGLWMQTASTSALAILDTNNNYHFLIDTQKGHYGFATSSPADGYGLTIA
ncbi:hypothetical protein COZ84_01270, partial [Candidatus Kuenenbacteria bacterium CG_4_8_14_3_um_filter_39_15]